MILTGSYKITQKNRILCENHNIITLMGESFFLHRAIDSEFNPMKYIVLGDSSILANKNDLNLGNETVRKLCSRTVDLDNKQIVLNCTCTVREIENTCEIGVANDEILISHDIYELDETLIDPALGDVEISYIFQLATLTDRKDWKYASSLDTVENNETVKNNIYYIYEDNNVINVLEKNSKSGYHCLASKEALKLNKGAYYYDFENKALYIRTMDEDNPNPNDSKYEILIQTTNGE